MGSIKYVEIKKYVVINFLSQFLFQLYYHTLPYTETKNNYPREKLTTTNTLTSICKVDLEKS